MRFLQAVRNMEQPYAHVRNKSDYYTQHKKYLSLGCLRPLLYLNRFKSQYLSIPPTPLSKPAQYHLVLSSIVLLKDIELYRTTIYIVPSVYITVPNSIDN